MPPESTCPTCHLPTEPQSSGRITQWLSTCSCGLQRPQEDQTATVDICMHCGKRVREGRKGSFTQFIFRSDLCACDVPQFLQTANRTGERPEKDSQPQIEEDELEVDPERFPLERYKPVNLLGKGSAGTVYYCRDRLLQKRVIVKTLHVYGAEQLVAFHKEAKVLSKLDHPNIVHILDFGATTSGAPYMVLDYSPGSSLDSHIRDNGELDWKTAVFAFTSLAAALEYCHKRNVFHRDLKPSNILMAVNDNQSTVKLFDFGVAELQTDDPESQHATIVGTPAYMAPDQALGREYDARSEIYAFGCVMFEAITGRPPFTGETALEIIAKHAQEIPPSFASVGCADIPASLENLVFRCLEKSPDDRFSSMQEVGHNLWSIAQASETAAKTIDGSAAAAVVAKEMSVQSRSGIAGKLSLMPLHLKVLSFLAATVTIVFLGNLVYNFAIKELFHPPSRTSPKKPQLWITKFNVYKEGAVGANPEVTDADLDQLLQYNGVSEVNLSATSIKGKNFSVLRKLKNLTVLNLEGTAIDDDSLQEVAKLKRLERLGLASTDIGDKGLKQVEKLKKLEMLFISSTRISDEGMKSVNKLELLQKLYISGCSITGKGLSELHNPKLVLLSIYDDPGISKSDLANFKIEHPNCRVQADPDNFVASRPVLTAANTDPQFKLFTKYREHMKDLEFRAFFQKPDWRIDPATIKNPRIQEGLRDKELKAYLSKSKNLENWNGSKIWTQLDDIDQQMSDLMYTEADP